MKDKKMADNSCFNKEISTLSVDDEITLLLAGQDIEPPAGGWGGNAGVVQNATGGNFGLAYRVLDAQYTRVAGFPRAIPQRRRRVFVVGHIGSWERAAEVLFEPGSLFGDTPPCRKTREEIAAGTGERAEGADGMVGVAGQSFGGYGCADSAGILKANGGDIGATLDTSCDHSAGIVQEKAFPINGMCLSRKPEDRRQSLGIGDGGEPLPTISTVHSHAVGLVTKGENVMLPKLRVRRLTPLECERLMGFPDGWTRIPWKGKPAEDCPDGPRYKACGNSMCVNCMEWLGRSIEFVDNEIKRRKINEWR